MFIKIKPIPQWMLMGSCGIVLAAILAASFILLVYPHLKPVTSLASAITTCAQSPDAKHCNGQNPATQGCATDAQTLSQALIDSDGQGHIIGILQRRFSAKCKSWWGRLIDAQPGVQEPLDLTVGGITVPWHVSVTFNNCQILFSAMIFNAPGNQPPEVVGTMEVTGINPFPSATIPTGN